MRYVLAAVALLLVCGVGCTPKPETPKVPAEPKAEPTAKVEAQPKVEAEVKVESQAETKPAPVEKTEVAVAEPPKEPPASKLNAQWIWLDKGEPATSADSGKVWFRMEGYSSVPCTGALKIVCDDHFVVWCNGRRIGEGDAKRAYRFNLSGIVDAGTNVIGIEAENKEGKAGLLVSGGILFQNTRPDKGYSVSLDSSAEWRATDKQPEGDAWLKRNFDAQGWKPVKVLGKHESSPWKDVDMSETYLDRYAPAPGFEITRIGEPELVGILVNMTWGNGGRLLASRENGPIVNVIDNDSDGIYDRVTEYSDAVKNCQGLCMVFDDLYAMGSGPQGVGIYKLPDANRDGKADDVVFISPIGVGNAFTGKKVEAGKMSEHGPHDIIYGPDGFLYANIGNAVTITHKPEPTSPMPSLYEGYLLEPKFEDPRGHAIGYRAPGGTLWRFSDEGDKWWLETGGFRNEYDFAFNSQGDAFSYDSDMEWDAQMPWYRPTRVYHCPPGADFGWRSGTANAPAYYFDSLPGTVDTGRGSPTGVVFYEHEQLPEKLRGALLICDWSLGRIMAIPLEKKGASYAGEIVMVLTGNPLNVTDIEVDRDGSIVFTTGGRNSEGGIYRLTYKGDEAGKPAKIDSIEDPLNVPQLQSAWARERIRAIQNNLGEEKWKTALTAALADKDAKRRAKALVILAQFGPKPTGEQLTKLATDEDPIVRGLALWMLGETPTEDAGKVFAKALEDQDPHVRRRACEAYLHAGIEPPVDPLIELLGSDDRFQRFAARLALERVPVEKWRERVLTSDNDWVLLEGLLALYRLKGQFPASEALQKIVARLQPKDKIGDPVGLAQLRMIELALLADAPKSPELAKKLSELFPSESEQANLELSRTLAKLDVAAETPRFVEMLETVPSESTKIHLALCLRYMSQGWTPELKRRLLDWYESTKHWEGGASFGPYLANIVGASLERFTPEERKTLMLEWAKRPHATRLLIERSEPDDVADFADVASQLFSDLDKAPPSAERDKVMESLIASLGKSKSEVAQQLLRKLYDEQPDYRNDLARAMAANPNVENWSYLLRTLAFGDSTTQQQVIGALAKLDRKAETADDYRAVILTGLALRDAGGKSVTKLLAKWTDEPHAASLDTNAALAHYQAWFRKKFPDAAPADPPVVDSSKTKYNFAQVAEFLDSARGLAGDEKRGEQLFAKSNCIKCHQFGKVGESIGPDLSSVRRRFQRREIVESLLFPSKVISDQYKAVTVVTVDGNVFTGIPMKQIDKHGELTLLTPDAKKITLKVADIDTQDTATVSLMPENLLNTLTLEEIADLFAFLETSKFNEEKK